MTCMNPASWWWFIHPVIQGFVKTKQKPSVEGCILNFPSRQLAWRSIRKKKKKIASIWPRKQWWMKKKKEARVICLVIILSATRGRSAWLNRKQRLKATRTETSANPWSERGKKKGRRWGYQTREAGERGGDGKHQRLQLVCRRNVLVAVRCCWKVETIKNKNRNRVQRSVGQQLLSVSVGSSTPPLDKRGSDAISHFNHLCSRDKVTENKCST